MARRMAAVAGERESRQSGVVRDASGVAAKCLRNAFSQGGAHPSNVPVTGLANQYDVFVKKVQPNETSTEAVKVMAFGQASSYGVSGESSSCSSILLNPHVA